MLAQAREQSKKALKGFRVIISVCLIPCGSKIEDGELRRDLERGCCQCFHTHPCRFLHFLSWPPWALTVTLLYHPWIINPFFEESSMGRRALGPPFLLASGKTSILGNLTALHISHVRRNFIWPQLKKLIKTLAPAEHESNLVFRRFGFLKNFASLRKVSTVSSAACTLAKFASHSISNHSLQLPAYSNLGQDFQWNPKKYTLVYQTSRHVHMCPCIHIKDQVQSKQRRKHGSRPWKCEGNTARHSELHCAGQ